AFRVPLNARGSSYDPIKNGSTTPKQSAGRWLASRVRQSRAARRGMGGNGAWHLQMRDYEISIPATQQWRQRMWDSLIFQLPRRPFLRIHCLHQVTLCPYRAGCVDVSLLVCNSALICILPPLTFTVRSQGVNPGFLIDIV